MWGHHRDRRSVRISKFLARHLRHRPHELGLELQVHLSGDEQTARTVGARRGRPVVLTVDAEAGHVFFRADNGVWLVDEVPARHLRCQAD